MGTAIHAPFIRPSGLWRLVGYTISTVREDDPPHRCLRCSRTVRVGDRVILRRSAHENTRRCWGPIEEMVHYYCWMTMDLQEPGRLPLLGLRNARMERYGDYPWSPDW